MLSSLAKGMRMSRQQPAPGNRREEVNWKRIISDTLRDMDIVPDGFSGKITISFKDGGISYLEKKEVFK